MSIFAIADLHLSFGTNKPMDVFGTEWESHSEKIEEDWHKNVKEDDLVLLPGDFSWATYLKDTFKDFEYLSKLPGKKILLKGNHDYWWNTVNSMKKYLSQNKFENIDFLHNNSFEYENYIICGTRGWINSEDEEDKKVLRREKLRLQISLEDGIKKYGNDKKIIVCMHYPPFNNIKGDEYDFIKLMKDYGASKCIYGHLHGPSHKEAREGVINGIEFKLVSCDYTKFKLARI